MEYEVVIGLEVHVQLNTKTKIFCGCPTTFGAPANAQTCPICQGHPGTLPVLNKEALRKALLAGLALGCDIAHETRFDRKQYFYPDLPKAYQISQLAKPLCLNGGVPITVTNEDGSTYAKTIKLNRIHMEEDAGKLIHAETGLPVSYVDLNRAGVPLIEIVTEPDMRSPEEAYQYLTELKKILRYIDVSDCNMEEGSLRCDANISLRPKGETKLGVKAEVKNMNSFRGVKTALEYEIKRQTKLLDKGEAVVQETRLYDSKNCSTRSMRSKEEAHDYRYFPDPDLGPESISDEEIETARNALPELPQQKSKRFIETYGIPMQDVVVLTETRELAEYYETAVKAYPAQPKKIANWIMVEVNARLNETLTPITAFKPKPEHIAEIFKLIDEGAISGKIAKEIFEDMTETGEAPSAVVERKGLKQLSDLSALQAIIRTMLEENASVVAEYKGGKEKSFGFLVGQAMKATRGQANPQMVNDLLKKLLDG